MSTTVEPTAAPAPDALRKLHARLAAAVRELGEPEAFYNRYVAELVDGLQLAGAAVWLADGEERTRLAAFQHVDSRDLGGLERLARTVLAEGFGTVVPPDDPKTPPNKRRNPTDGTVMLYPIRLGTTTVGATVALLPSDAPRGMAAGLSRVLVPLCDFAAEFAFRAAAAPSDACGATTSAGSNDAVAQFALDVHASLDVRRTAETIANEVRRLLDCDRAAVAIVARRRATALAFSGQDQFDSRSNLVRLWEKLTTVVAAGGEQLDYPSDGSQLAPQVTAALEALIDESHARRMIVVPLAVGDGEPIGVLTLEQIAPGPAWPATVTRRLAEIVPHAASALSAASSHEALPLRWLATLPGLAQTATAARNLPRTLLVLGSLFAVVAVLTLLPWEFTVEAPGTLQPVVRRDVFAAVDGTVERVFIRTGDMVKRGDPLVELRNPEMDLADADLLKQINETEQQLLNAERLYNQDRTLSQEERSRLPGEIAVLEQRRESLRRAAALLTEKRQRLHLVSPMDGQIATWNVVEQLSQRPVRQGQTLINLVDQAGEWELEVRLPEDRLGSVIEAQRDGKPQLEITFLSATDPGTEYRAVLRDVGPAAEPHADEGTVIRLHADLDKKQLAQLHPGADVRVRIHCGSRSLGYVLFHDVWSFVQSQILFRL